MVLKLALILEPHDCQYSSSSQFNDKSLFCFYTFHTQFFIINEFKKREEREGKGNKEISGLEESLVEIKGRIQGKS